ncbi:MAG: beta-phosphoglucomutase family hydrolase [Prolixibacteraceae bacterium]|jgi:beta-phosphoglucomutase family hydrolase|nr:beta-phosphoglucomutase family hydrolase [Prolixibacteraceae bacterium]
MKITIGTNVRALIFDLDGTLSDSLPVHIATWHKLCREMGCTFDERIVAEMTGMATISFAERIKKEQQLDVDPQEIVRRKQSYFWENAHQVKPIPAVVEVVKKYHKILPMAVGTGASRRSAELQLKTLLLTEYFDAIVTADDVDHHKPNPDTFLKCAQLMNVLPKDCVVFEDGELGMQAARKAGMSLIDVRPYLE